MSDAPTEFWMVWNPDGRAPVYRHETRSAATREAERLADLHPDKLFFVLRAEAVSRKSRPVETVRLAATDVIDDFDLPF